MPREFTSISGLNKSAMRAVGVARGAPLLIFFLLLPMAGALAQEPPSPPADSIRVSVERVNVGVIVTDGRGKFIEGLGRDDFHVFDNGAEQPITDLAPVDEPAQVLMLVEAGPSVYFLEAGHIQATHALLAGLSAGDRIAVAKYDISPQILVDFTANKQLAEAALAKVRYYIGFGNLNLSRSLLAMLDSLAKVQGKKTIVLLSTGFDTSQTEEISALLARLQNSDVRILAISLGAELRNPPSTPQKQKGKKQQQSIDKTAITQQGFADADRLLSALTEATGGRVYFPNSAKDFAAVYSEVAGLVRHEYSLAFAPPTRDGKSHIIDVRISHSSEMAPTPTDTNGYRIDHRRAYVAPVPQ
jgi:Ca-activated chloride channel family protein